MLVFNRKLDLTEEKNVIVNSIAGSNRKQRKKQKTKDEREQSDGEESIHTSDMSTDEEDDSGVDIGEEGKAGTDGRIETSSPDSTHINSGSDTVGGNITENTELIVNKTEDIVDRRKIDEIAVQSKLKSSDLSASADRVCDSKIQTNISRKKHVRSTSSNWNVEEISKSISDSLSKSDCQTLDVVTDSSICTKHKSDYGGESNLTTSVSDGKQLDTNTYARPGSATVEDEIHSTPKEIKPAKKAVNIPVDRDETVQVGQYCEII